MFTLPTTFWLKRSATALGRTWIVTVASEVPAVLVSRYWKVNIPVKPVDGVKVNAPFDCTTRLPPVPKFAVVPAASEVTVPPSDPPPNDVRVATGNPSESLSSRSSVSDVTRLKVVFASVRYGPSLTALGGALTPSVKFWTAFGGTPLLAVNVSG